MCGLAAADPGGAAERSAPSWSTRAAWPWSSAEGGSGRRRTGQGIGFGSAAVSSAVPAAERRSSWSQRIAATRFSLLAKWRKTPISRRYQLADGAQACVDLLRERTRGKLVVRCGDGI